MHSIENENEFLTEAKLCARETPPWASYPCAVLRMRLQMVRRLLTLSESVLYVNALV